MIDERFTFDDAIDAGGGFVASPDIYKEIQEKIQKQLIQHYKKIDDAVLETIFELEELGLSHEYDIVIKEKQNHDLSLNHTVACVKIKDE